MKRAGENSLRSEIREAVPLVFSVSGAVLIDVWIIQHSIRGDITSQQWFLAIIAGMLWAGLMTPMVYYLFGCDWSKFAARVGRTIEMAYRAATVAAGDVRTAMALARRLPAFISGSRF